jgi:hypothetical protein
MKTVGTNLAFPFESGGRHELGLTKREYFAAMVLRAVTHHHAETSAARAVACADALIEALNAKEGKT